MGGGCPFLPLQDQLQIPHLCLHLAVYHLEEIMTSYYLQQGAVGSADGIGGVVPMARGCQGTLSSLLLD